MDNVLFKPYLHSAEDLTLEQVNAIFDKAQFFIDNYNSKEKFKDLLGVTVALAFFEPSTRTRLSFELAAKHLSADILIFKSIGSSIVKGESFVDTIRTTDAMNVKMYVVRSVFAGVPQLITQKTGKIVINAGDGKHEHPTQALLDALTLKQHYKTFAGLKVCIVGDVLHSRVARSNITILRLLGAEVRLIAPGTLLPRYLRPWNIEILETIDEAIDWADALIVLRLQKERMENGVLPSLSEFVKFYQVTYEKFTKKDKIVLLHPGPVNYGIELDYKLSDLSNCLINKQVTNGVFIRMAVMSLLQNNSEKCE